MSDYPNERDCQHGQLRRSCPTCAAEANYAALLARHTALVEAVTRLQKLDRDRPLHPVTDGRLIDARAEVDRLLGEAEG